MRRLKLTLLALALAVTAFAAPSLQVRVRPTVQFAVKGGKVYVITTLQPNPHNRRLCVAVDGPLYAVSCREISPLSHAVTAEWPFSGLVAGRYEAVGVVEREGGAVERVTAPFRVIGLGDGEDD